MKHFSKGPIDNDIEVIKTIIYTCPYVPTEWIAAHGLRPSRVMMTAAETAGSIGRVEGVCPFVRRFVNEVLTNQQTCSAIVTTVCDQMRRGFDIVRKGDIPAFLMNIPNTWQNSDAQKLYLEELNRLGRFLIGLGGKAPTNGDLAQIMLEYDSARRFILAAKGHLGSRQYSEAIAEFNQDGKSDIAKHITDKELLTNGIPLVIIGGPLLREDFDIFDVIESCGGLIVLDATETGERGMCVQFDYRRLHEAPLMELANAYFGSIPDASRRPNNQLYDWLERELVCREVRGIIFRRYIWCDIWHAELYRLKQWTDLPVLDIDVSGNGEALSARSIQRIQAFLEMLR
ncbi:MAG: 2-hydroxyacyl-CoA dehydratase [Planctomycetota bacterium]